MFTMLNNISYMYKSGCKYQVFNKFKHCGKLINKIAGLFYTQIMSALHGFNLLGFLSEKCKGIKSYKRNRNPLERKAEVHIEKQNSGHACIMSQLITYTKQMNTHIKSYNKCKPKSQFFRAQNVKFNQPNSFWFTNFIPAKNVSILSNSFSIDHLFCIDVVVESGKESPLLYLR